MLRVRKIIFAVLVVGVATTALAADIPNGSFEDITEGTGWVDALPNWTGWTASPSATMANERVGLFFSFSYTAVDGIAFGAITNNNDIAQKLRSGTFTLQTAEITFNYVYVTQNVPEDTTHVDPFTVTLVTTTSQTYTIADTNSNNLIAGTVGNSPFSAGPMTYDTGWRTFTINADTLVGQSAYLEFTINDSAAGGLTSGAFLNNITNIPEPGTLILFGIGFLGITAYGRRKIRTRK